MKRRILSAVIVLCTFAATTFAQAPANDECANATDILCGETLSGTTIGAAADAVGTCGTSATAPGVFYSFFGTGDNITVSLCSPNTDYDTKLSVFEGSCAGLVCVDGNDDACGLISEVTFNSNLGTTYFFYVHGFSADEGNFEITVTCNTIGVVANDLCADAQPILCGETLAGTTTGATSDGVATCGTSNTAPGVWYSFTGNGGTATVSLCNNATYDSKISVFTDGCGTLTCIGGNDDGTGCGLTSEFSFASTLGTDYLILVHGFGSDVGDFSLTLTCGPPIGAPANDDCTDAVVTAVANGTPATVSGTTLGATADAFETSEFGFAVVWEAFSVTGACNNVELSYCGSFSPTFNIFARIYNSCNAADFIEEDDGSPDDLSCGDGNLTYTFSGLPAGTYLVPVFADIAFLDPLGDYSLTINSVDCPALPANDL